MIALARKYRPRRFADLLVQDHVAAALKGAVAKGRVGHGYLLTGPRGVGKTTAARILAMALNCERRDVASPTGEPCGECPTCDRIWSGGANLDVVEIDAASNRSVDDARELRERAMYASSQEGGYKVYIVDEAHMLTREAWNALLKILEEPPPRVVFVFATTEPQKIANNAAPVLSRLQRFDFRRIGAAAIRARITEVLASENLAADEDAIAVIARYADGGMRDALSVLDQALSLAEGSLSADRVRQALGLISDELYGEVLNAVAAKDGAAIFPVVDRLLASGADLVEFIGGMAELLRAVLMMATGAEPDGLTAIQREVVVAAKKRLSAGDVLRMLGLLSQAEVLVRRSGNPRLAVETLLLRWTLMDRTVDLEAVLASESLSAPASGSPAGGPGGRSSPPPRSAPIRAGAAAGGEANRGRASALAAPAAASDAPAPSAPVRAGPIFEGGLDVGVLRAGWTEVAARARGRSPLLATVIESLSPVGVNQNRVALAVEGNDVAHMLEGAQRQQRAIEELLSAAAGRPVVVTFGSGIDQGELREKPKRLSEKDLKDEKLRDFRARDAALDAAADALDLEIVD